MKMCRGVLITMTHTIKINESIELLNKSKLRIQNNETLMT